MWNNIQPSQCRLGSWNWFCVRWGEGIRKRDTFLNATLVIVFVSVNKLYVHVPKEFSIWNSIQHSQLHLGSLIWFDVRWGERIRKRDTRLKATLIALFVSVNELYVHVPKTFSMWNNIQHSQLRLGSWIWLDFRWWGESTRKRDTLLKATLVISFVSVNKRCVHFPNEFSMWNNI